MFIIYHKATRAKVTQYKRRGNAVRYLSKIEGAEKFAIVPEDEYYGNVVKTRLVKNLMTGLLVEIDSNTPWCCNPASETYWTM